MPKSIPFTLDPANAAAARFGDQQSIAACALALQQGIAYASDQAVHAAGYDLDVDQVVAGVRQYLGLPAHASNQDNPYSVPIIQKFLQQGHYFETPIRGMLREIARAVVSDLIHHRQPRAGLRLRVRRVITRLVRPR